MVKNEIERWLFNIRPRNFLPGLIIFLFLLGGIWFAIIQRDDKAYVPTQAAPVNRIIQVEVNGAVVNPGLYELDVDGRVFEAIAAAGGLLPGADTRGINLAEHLYNGQQLEIPYPNNTYTPVSTETPSIAVLVDEPRKSVSTDMEASEGAAVPSLTSTPGSDACSKPVVGSGVFIWPVQARFLSGNDFSPDHPGIDIAAGIGSPVYAADSGVISLEGNDSSGYGNVIEIDHGNGYSTMYAHLSVIEVQTCRSVYAGQRIGLAGNTGNADGAHLHFEMIREGVYIDPWSVLPEP